MASEVRSYRPGEEKDAVAGAAGEEEGGEEHDEEAEHHGEVVPC